MRWITSGVIAASVVGAAAKPVLANPNENVSWQFRSAQERANLIIAEDMRQKRISGFYAPPIYNTRIDRQFNCSVGATALANQASTGATANSPTTDGVTSGATANDSSTIGADGRFASNNATSTSQTNSGFVQSKAQGVVTTSVSGQSYQVLNTEQGNSGNQTATVSGSSGCNFADSN